MDFESALRYLQSLQKFGIKLGNDRIEAILTRMGNPHHRFAVAHIAGTKGKGSTTAMIAAILQAHGFSVGSYFSPYVYDIRERVQVNGTMIPRDDFARLVTEIAPFVEAVAETDLGQATEFEMKTAVGFEYFAEQSVDYAAVEVGIGGRLDATNVVSPLACVITNIGLDHTHILGDTHAKIAAEKAGIIKPGIPVVTAVDDREAFQVICRTAAERKSPMTIVRQAPSSELSHTESLMRLPHDESVSWSEQSDGLRVQTQRACYSALKIRLQGAFQYPNAACAIPAVEVLAAARGFEISMQAVREGLRTAYVPGRLEVVHREPLVVMDGAHNRLAARALAKEIQRWPFRRLLLVIGMAAGHDPEEVVPELAQVAAKIYATQPTWNRAIDAEAVARIARQSCSDVTTLTPPLAAAKQALHDATPEDLVLITGSFYVVGDVPADLLLNR